MNFWDKVFNLINGMAGKNHLLDSIMVFSSQKLPYVLATIIIVIYLIGVFKKDKRVRGLAVDAVIFTALNLVISGILSHIWYAPRPFVENSKTHLLYPHKADSSFPSDHSLASMSIALGLNRYSKIVGEITICMSILIGISRVYVGHHYPQHVIESFCIVIIMSFVYNKFLSSKVQSIYFKIEKYIPILNKLI
ncbi:phosphatase PAP2 family protein [Paraclostridium bifermentans]|uniref:Phosphatase PAP2 family protein n=1 Tax=Paraclostridium bifermentans TaxID=1490 RepID=A0ABY8R6P5_PARBF|nr:phosphatase PAP2 family protein [Paraclostridium bifermentans]